MHVQHRLHGTVKEKAQNMLALILNPCFKEFEVEQNYVCQEVAKESGG